MTTLPWTDAHLDLASLAVVGRDLTATTEVLNSPLAPPTPLAKTPAAVSFPALAEAPVTTIFATIFTGPRNVAQGLTGPCTYDSPEEAHLAARTQLAHYLTWHTQGHLTLEGLPAAQRIPTPSSAPSVDPPRTILLLEGAAPLRSPADLEPFCAAGLRIVALAWAKGTPYAGGNETLTDVTPAGLDLLAEIDRRRLLHDVSHLSEKAFWTVLDRTTRPKLASHSNCRALLTAPKWPERHLSDRQIRALAEQGGIIGINLYSPFLTSTGRAGVSNVLDHIKRIADLLSSMAHIGLGSDMDGGFAANDLPIGLDHPRQLPRLAEALAAAGFSDPDIHAFAHQNWQSFLTRHLP